MNIMICDPVSPKGIALFQQRPEFKVTVLKQKLSEAELLPMVADMEAMVVRSETKITRKVIAAASPTATPSFLAPESAVIPASEAEY